MIAELKDSLNELNDNEYSVAVKEIEKNIKKIKNVIRQLYSNNCDEFHNFDRIPNFRILSLSPKKK